MSIANEINAINKKHRRPTRLSHRTANIKPVEASDESDHVTKKFFIFYEYSNKKQDWIKNPYTDKYIKYLDTVMNHGKDQDVKMVERLWKRYKQVYPVPKRSEWIYNRPDKTEGEIYEDIYTLWKANTTTEATSNKFRDL